MRKVVFFLSLICFHAAGNAQSAKTEIEKNVRLSAGSVLTYMVPRQQQSSPSGMKPFYISHFGRSGSHYLDDTTDYDYPYNTLRRAASLGKLTPMGQSILERVEAIRNDAQGRLGELTPSGYEQQKRIVRRMFERFPEVFADDAHVDAKSTLSERCILSMENALQELLVLNPKLQVTHSASRLDLYYMAPNDSLLRRHATEPSVMEPYQKFCQRHDPSDKLMTLLFNDAGYVKSEINASRFNSFLFRLVSHLQNTELRKNMTLYDIYSDADLYENWLRDNARSYITYAASPLNGGRQPFMARELLRQIIYEADSIVSNRKPGLTLRFGHESTLLPLICLLNLNDYGQQIADLNQVDRKGWRNYKMIPMAANVQFVFYRRIPDNDEIYFKVLLNEDETSLPLKSSKAPYYRWSDFRERYLQFLNSYQEEPQP